MRKGTGRRLIILLLAIYCLIYALLGFKVSVPGRLASAQAKWGAQHIDDYRYHVQFSAFNDRGSVLITVANGQVIKIEGDDSDPPDASKLTPIESKPDWYMNTFSPDFLPELSMYSATGLFVLAASVPQPLVSICGRSDHYAISYDDVRGYVNGVRFSDCPSWDYGLGLLCGQHVDCSKSFRVTDFTDLSDT